jgi:16S rRNA (guanine966-N2)-methyltransferase
MRIIAGRLRRRTLRAPQGLETRPSTDRTRESLFNLLQSRLDFNGVGVLDLFAGTGALGFEAISRGAGSVLFVEENPKVLKVARQNAEELDVVNACTFIRADAVAYLKRYSGPPFDLILADPPYELEALPRLPDLALRHVAPGGFFSLEHDARHSFEDHPLLETSRAYGRTIVSVFAAGETSP